MRVWRGGTRLGQNRGGQLFYYEMIVKAVRAGFNSSSGHMGPPGLSLPTSGPEHAERQRSCGNIIWKLNMMFQMEIEM